MMYAKGTLLLLSVAVVFTIAFQFYKRKEVDKALVFIVLGGFILRGWCMTDAFLHEWD